MWTDSDKQWLEDNRETIEKSPDFVFEIASDENFELGKSSGLYQKLAMAIAYVKSMDPEIVISPDSDEEYMCYFCLGGYAIYTFPVDPEANLSDVISEFFREESGLPESIWKLLYSRSHVETRNW